MNNTVQIKIYQYTGKAGEFNTFLTHVQTHAEDRGLYNKSIKPEVPSNPTSTPPTTGWTRVPAPRLVFATLAAFPGESMMIIVLV